MLYDTGRRGEYSETGSIDRALQVEGRVLQGRKDRLCVMYTKVVHLTSAPPRKDMAVAGNGAFQRPGSFPLHSNLCRLRLSVVYLECMSCGCNTNYSSGSGLPLLLLMHVPEKPIGELSHAEPRNIHRMTNGRCP